jgi:hypothetical protein
MQTNVRQNLVAPCGIDCGICELYTCKDNPQLLNYLVSTGIPKENLPCAGCRSIEGNCPVIKGKCDTYSCIQQNRIDFCHECNDFPCPKLNPAADRADILPHNTKVFNLCTIKNTGIENFIKKSADIKLKYYKGKMMVGKGPQIEN